MALAFAEAGSKCKSLHLHVTRGLITSYGVCISLKAIHTRKHARHGEAASLATATKVELLRASSAAWSVPGSSICALKSLLFLDHVLLRFREGFGGVAGTRRISHLFCDSIASTAMSSSTVVTTMRKLEGLRKLGTHFM